MYKFFFLIFLTYPIKIYKKLYCFTPTLSKFQPPTHSVLTTNVKLMASVSKSSLNIPIPELSTVFMTFLLVVLSLRRRPGLTFCSLIRTFQETARTVSDIRFDFLKRFLLGCKQIFTKKNAHQGKLGCFFTDLLFFLYSFYKNKIFLIKN